MIYIYSTPRRGWIQEELQQCSMLHEMLTVLFCIQYWVTKWILYQWISIVYLEQYCNYSLNLGVMFVGNDETIFWNICASSLFVSPCVSLSFECAVAHSKKKLGDWYTQKHNDVNKFCILMFLNIGVMLYRSAAK